MLGLVCRIADSCVAGNQLRSSCVLDFLAVLVDLVQIYFLSGYFSAATPEGG